jgi:hypothetical protein
MHSYWCANILQMGATYPFCIEYTYNKIALVRNENGYTPCMSPFSQADDAYAVSESMAARPALPAEIISGEPMALSTCSRAEIRQGLL